MCHLQHNLLNTLISPQTIRPSPTLLSLLLFQAWIQNVVGSTQYKDNVKPTLWEEFTSMIINDISTLAHSIFQFIDYL